MKCVICRKGRILPGTATVTLTRDAMTLVVKGVPASVCQNCDEEYIEETTTAKLLETAEEAVRAGVQVEVREYVAA